MPGKGEGNTPPAGGGPAGGIGAGLPRTGRFRVGPPSTPPPGGAAPARVVSQAEYTRLGNAEIAKGLSPSKAAEALAARGITPRSGPGGPLVRRRTVNQRAPGTIPERPVTARRRAVPTTEPNPVTREQRASTPRAQAMMAKYGPDFYRRIGSRGGSTSAARLGHAGMAARGRAGGNRTKATQGSAHYSRIGRIGGARSRPKSRPNSQPLAA